MVAFITIILSNDHFKTYQRFTGIFISISIRVRKTTEI